MLVNRNNMMQKTHVIFDLIDFLSMGGPANAKQNF